MTFVGSLKAFEERRARGEAPKGGVLQEEAAGLLDFPAPREMTPQGIVEKLDAVLTAFWNHPLDIRLYDAVCRLSGGVCGLSPAKMEVHSAANFRYRETNGKWTHGEPRERDRACYDELVKLTRELA